MIGIRGEGDGGCLILRIKLMDMDTVMDTVYEKSRRAWSALEVFRRDRSRCKRYVFGEQWDDLVTTEDGVEMTEKQFIMLQGQTPMKNNVLRRILRNVVGVYRANYRLPDGADASAELAYRANRLEQLMPRLLEEFLISGLVVVKNERGGRGECKTRILPVTPDNFFLHSDGYDPRGWDVDMLGEVHQVDYRSVVGKFCRTAGDLRKIEEIYGGSGGGRCRVTEVWYRDSYTVGLVHDRKRGRLHMFPAEMIRQAMARSGMEQGGIRAEDVSIHMRRGWRCAWFAADGTLIRVEPMQERHPYVWKAYPFIDGEVHSYVSDIIDQQRYVNHLITLYDFIMKSSAKGVLLFPDESIPRGMTMQEVADEWSRFNGVIPYRAQPGVPLPTQVSGNAANIGISELLKIEMQMLEDISGVSPTLQGKLENLSASGTLFAQQNEAAMTSLLDVVRTFDEFAEEVVRGI